MTTMKTATRPRGERGGQFSSSYAGTEHNHQQERQERQSYHHVTEAFGDYYLDDPIANRDSRPSLRTHRSRDREAYDQSTDRASSSGAREGGMSSNSRKTSLSSTSSTSIQHTPSPSPSHSFSSNRKGTTTSRSNSQGHENTPPSRFPNSGPSSPTLADAASTAYPLNDIDYESNPAAVQKELNNLQALRRMSMDVGSTADPDLPNGFNFNPTLAPTGQDDDLEDASRLFWVPARLHPELAPKEFKSFVETRVKEIHHRGDGSLSPDGSTGSRSGGSLSRKKSMLSRQIDNTDGRAGEGYQDGAERLERRRSQRISVEGQAPLKLEDLKQFGDELVKDPAQLMRKLSIDTQRSTDSASFRSSIESMEAPNPDDRPILPAAPPGHTLKRSTRTTYRRGSLRKEGRVSTGRRSGRLTDTDPEELSISPSNIQPLSRVRTEPIPSISITTEEPPRHPYVLSPVSSLDDGFAASNSPKSLRSVRTFQDEPLPREKKRYSDDDEFPSRPKVVEAPGQSEALPKVVAHSPAVQSEYESPPPREPPPKSSRRPQPRRQSASSKESTTTINDLVSTPVPGPSPVPAPPPQPVAVPAPQPPASHPASNINTPTPLPGSGSLRTDDLTYIPTWDDNKQTAKSARKSSDSKLDRAARKQADLYGTSPPTLTPTKREGEKKSGWSWGSLLGGDDKKEERERDNSKVKKVKKQKSAEMREEASYARLDVIQKSINEGRRESSEFDRSSIDTGKKSEKEKEKKETGLFSSLFGGKKKGDDDKKKAKSLRANSPEPAPSAKTEYYWTRFPIHVERAIYRLSHLKLANPRRPLQQQVLLSNFMYAYLAKVQQMQPSLITGATGPPAQSSPTPKEQPSQQQQVPAQPAPEIQEPHGSGEEYWQDPNGQAGMEEMPEDQEYYYDDGSGVDYVEDNQMYDYNDSSGQMDHQHHSGDPYMASTDDVDDRPESRRDQYNHHNGYAGSTHQQQYHYEQQHDDLHQQQSQQHYSSSPPSTHEKPRKQHYNYSQHLHYSNNGGSSGGNSTGHQRENAGMW